MNSDLPSASARFKVSQTVYFHRLACTVAEVLRDEQGFLYNVVSRDVGLPFRLPEEQLNETPVDDKPILRQTCPHLVVVDEFLNDPNSIRDLAVRQTFVSDIGKYKGQRTSERYLWPGLREEFERLLHCTITDWLDQPMNGVFQITGFNDPLVWHHDTQDYAAALYLTPDAPISAGTSFWQLKATGSRRPSSHPLEFHRFNDNEKRSAADEQIYDLHNIVHPDNWELCDRVGGVYNRLVLWDAKMIHSASSYEGLLGGDAKQSRLVQLFFFSIA